MRRRGLVALAAALPLLLGLAACGADPAGSKAPGGGKSTAQAAADQDKMRRFAQCMRDNGIDMADPETDGDGGVVFGAGPGGGRRGKDMSSADREKTKQAMRKCRHLMPNGGQPPKLSPEDAAKMRQFAKCMRQHGVDFPDPDPDGRVKVNKDSIDPADPDLKEARDACRQYSPKRQREGAR